MSALVHKEIRGLLPMWLLAMALAIFPIWVVWPLGFGVSSLPEAPGGAVFVPFALGVLLLSVTAFGQEFSVGTFSSLLVQPMSRQRIWRLKTVTLGCALALVVIAFGLSTIFRVTFVWGTTEFHVPYGKSGEFFVSFLRGTRHTAYSAAFGQGTALALMAFAGGLWTTLLFRQTGPSIAFTILIPGGLYFFFGGLFEILSAGVHSLVNFTLPPELYAAALYAPVGFLYARRMFFQAQDVQWTGGVISLPERRLGDQDAAIALRAPKRKPFRASLRKEFQSHQITLLLAAALLLLHLMTLAFRWLGATYLDEHRSTRFAMETLPILWLVMPMMIGAMTIAEERKSGTLEAQLTLPARRRLQFFAKFVVAMALGIFLGGIIPLLVEGLGLLLHSHGQLQGVSYQTFNGNDSMAVVLFFGGLIASLLSVLASSLTRNMLQSLGLTVVLCILTVILIVKTTQSVPDDILFFTTPLFALVSWPLLALTATWLAYQNYQCIQIDWRIVRRNFYAPIVCLAAASLVTILIYHRVWEIWQPQEPRHGNFSTQSFYEAGQSTPPPAKIECAPARIAVLFQEGRLWLQQSDRQIVETQSNGVTSLALGRMGASHAGFVAGSNWLNVAVTFENCYAIRTDGSMWDLSELQPDRDSSSPKPFGENRDWKKIGAGFGVFAAVKSDGTLWEWGRPRLVSSNVTETMHIPTPTRIGTDHDWTEVWSSPFAVVAMKQDGSIWRWHFVRSTNNVANSVDRPERWLNMPHPDPISVSACDDAIAAVFSDGSLWIGGEPTGWGIHPAARHAHEMVRWGQDSDWQQVLVSPFAMSGIRRHGSLWRLYNLSVANPGSPPVTVSRHSDWIALGNNGRLLTLAADGSLVQWREPQDDVVDPAAYIRIRLSGGNYSSEPWVGSRNPWLGPSRIRARKIADVR